MTKLWNTSLLAFLVNNVFGQERYAPGVPPPQQGGADIKFHDPNEYQQPPPQQQQQQYQPPAAGQQPPVQQGHPPQQQQGGHHGEGGHHHDHQFGETLDQEHLEKHKKDKYVDTSKMSERERIWYQFQNFDLDKDGLVDGMEIIKSILHYKGEHAEEEANGQEQQRSPEADAASAKELESFADSADEALKLYDVNDDGYISFKEFAEKMMPANAQHET